MSHYEFHNQSIRISKAKMAQRLGTTVERILQVCAGLFVLALVVLAVFKRHQAFTMAGLTVMLGTSLIWLRRDLGQLPAAYLGASTDLDQLLPAALAATYRPTMSAGDLWTMLAATPDGQFICARFGLTSDTVAAALGTGALDHDALWTETERLAHELGLAQISPALAILALFHLNADLTQLLTRLKLTLEDLGEGALWLARLDSYITRRRPIYGGIARDWASGFTPLLAKFGDNLSQRVEFAGKHFVTEERTNQLDALVTGLDSANGSVVLIGEPGIGKTALLLGLADRLLEGKQSGSLSHHQIVALNASFILSNSPGQGDIESTVLNLFAEAVHAGNIIIALDEAQLFFGQGTGAVNLSQVLLPLLQSHRIKLVLALTPGDWQKLKATNSAMTSLLTPLVLAEAGRVETMRVLADRALLLEHGKFVTTWSALAEAYRLSGRYFQDEAYPGRAIKLLEAALNHPDGTLISDRAVQQAVESQFGVKVQQATAAESEVLLHLEDKIHERMINQTRAVSVVAGALRRARAGVANPKRPIGSFLFLGPTGVGKTELAKSIAALYFGDENNVIRLDMSEYQQVADVDRILGPATDNPEGLLPRVRQTPFSVVLFDEIEKAHTGILNLFLQLLDEGNLTDTADKPASFKDAIVIATSNAGADEIRKHIEAGAQLEQFEEEFVNHLISSGAFKPELLNRFDEIVLFRPLNQSELGQVVKLMIAEVNKTLANQKITVALTDDASAELVKTGYDPRLGARPMRRMVTRRVEDTIAAMILKGDAKPGDTITLDAAHLNPPASGVHSGAAPIPPAV
ncbi:MAG TPA: AAA family ATPase [Candidatus Saccharimonadia bacterium]|jgi:ATP-dependent Clp protease ATP-binding subunit ClpC